MPAVSCDVSQQTEAVSTLVRWTSDEHAGADFHYHLTLTTLNRRQY